MMFGRREQSIVSKRCQDSGRRTYAPSVTNARTNLKNWSSDPTFVRRLEREMLSTRSRVIKRASRCRCADQISPSAASQRRRERQSKSHRDVPGNSRAS